MLPFQQSHAFLIGIDDYLNIRPLHAAVNDVKKLGQILAKKHGFNVRVSINTNLEELRTIIHREIPNTLGSINPGERHRCLFYFAGHGIALDSKTGPNGFLIPADARRNDRTSLLPMDELNQVMEQLPVDHGLLLLDCCFSGAYRWSNGKRDLDGMELPNVIYEERFRKYCFDPAWQVICSSSHDQKANDILLDYSLGYRAADEGVNSPFALSLFDALEGAADIIPVDGGDGLITASELYLFLRDKVESATITHDNRQTPQMFYLPRHDKGEFIFLSPGHVLNLPSTPKRNPYLGLNSYDEEDALLFFGREKVLKRFLSHVEKQQLIVLTGASGTGKSSLIKAGLLPKLRSQGYHILPVFRPGKEPYSILRKNVYPEVESSTGIKTILVIDQFEELITQAPNKKISEAFQKELRDILESYPNLKLIISIRSDFEPQFKKRGGLKDLWHNARFVITPFSSEELRQIVIKPAIQEIFQFNPDRLVNQIVDEVSQAPGGLPLLSFTMSELYHAYIDSGRTDRLFTEQMYYRLGGIVGSLHTKADQLYHKLDEKGRDIMRRIMLRMVSLEGGETAGKRVFLDELTFPDDQENQIVKIVLNLLLEGRLIICTSDLSGRIYAEPAHDALVKGWPTLWEWMKEVGSEGMMLQNKLNVAVEDYENTGKEKKMLWDDDPRLHLLDGDISLNKSWMTQREIGFVNASIKRRKYIKIRNYTLLIGIILGLTSLTGVALFQAEIASQMADNAAHNAQNEKRQRQRADSNANVANRKTYEAEENLKRANKNLIQAYKFQIRVLEGRIQEERRKERLAKDANLEILAKKHISRINSMHFEVRQIRKSIDGLKLN